MTTNCLTRCTFAALVLAISLNTSFAQVIWTESFSNQEIAASNWVSGGTNEGSQTWVWLNDQQAFFAPEGFAAPTASDGFFMFDSDANGYNAHSVTLTGPVVECPASANSQVTFWAQYMYIGSPNAELQVSVDGGEQWVSHTLFESVFPLQMFNGLVTVSIPEADGHNTVRLRFLWSGINELAWKIDDVTLTGSPDVPPSACQMNPNAVICDNFDDYNPALKLGPQSAWWTPWFGEEGAIHDGDISTEQASSGVNALKIVSTSPFGGLQSSIFQMGNLGSGLYDLKFKVFVPAGKTAYYDLRQAIPIVMGGNNLNVYFDTTGNGVIKNGSDLELATFTYTQGEWVNCHHRFNLNDDSQSFWINNILINTSPFTGDLGGVLFMGYNEFAVFYIDDVEFSTFEMAYTVDDCEGAVSLNAYLGGETGVAYFTSIFDNTNATANASDPDVPDCFSDGVPNSVPLINGSLWYAFTGDGGKYHIETVPCDATNYIDNGDTQMALFTGECGNFSPLLCNDDLVGAEDFRAGLDIETTPGMEYHLMVDGWSFPDENYVATGEFCLEITKLVHITCAEGVAGMYMVYEGYVCDGSGTGPLFSLFNESFVLPTVGDVHGISWAVTKEPVPAGVWPPDLDSYWGSFNVNPELYTPNLINNGEVLLQDTIWYFTPVVVANAVDNFPATPAYLHDLDISEACYYVGESAAFFLLPELSPLDVEDETVSPVGDLSNGSIDLMVSGGLFDLMQIPMHTYSVLWSGPNGFSSEEEDIDHLAPGTYTATITDMTGCIDPLIVSVTLQATLAATDPASMKSITLSPNPTAHTTRLDLQLTEAAEVRIEVLNTLGQPLEKTDLGELQETTQQIDLSKYTNGTYFLRVTIDGKTAMRRVVLNR